MRLTIDNLDGLGPQDYTSLVAAGKTPPSIHRRLNQPTAMIVTLAPGTSGSVVPATGAHVIVARANGSVTFSGQVAAVNPEYAGWGERGAVYCYRLTTLSDESSAGSEDIAGAWRFYQSCGWGHSAAASE